MTIKEKLISLFFKKCLHCNYYDINAHPTPTGMYMEDFCTKHKKKVKSTDTCIDWRITKK